MYLFSLHLKGCLWSGSQKTWIIFDILPIVFFRCVPNADPLPASQLSFFLLSQKVDSFWFLGFFRVWSSIRVFLQITWPEPKLAEPNLYGVRRTDFLHFLSGSQICFFKPEKWWLGLSWAELGAKFYNCDAISVAYDVGEIQIPKRGRPNLEKNVKGFCFQRVA